MCISTSDANLFCEQLDYPVVQRHAIVNSRVFDALVQLVV